MRFWLSQAWQILLEKIRIDASTPIREFSGRWDEVFDHPLAPDPSRHCHNRPDAVSCHYEYQEFPDL